MGGSYNYSAIFLERSYHLLKESGILGFIVNNSIARVDEFILIRRFLLDNTNLFEIIDEGNPFHESNVTLEMLSLFFKKLRIQDYSITIKSKRFPNKLPTEVSKDIFRKFDRFILYYDNIFQYIYENFNINRIHGKRGRDAPRSKLKVDLHIISYFFSGKSVKKFHPDFQYIDYASSDLLNNETWLNEYNSTIPITTKISNKFRVIIKPKKTLIGNNVIKLSLAEDTSINIYSLLLILNSKLMDYIVNRYIINYSEKL